MKRAKIFLGILLLLVGISSGSALEPNKLTQIQSEVENLINRFPAENAEERDTLAMGLLRLGSIGIANLCQQINPPGTEDDTKVRFAVNGIAVYVNKRNMARERLLFSKSLIKALNSSADREVQAFLIRQLQLVGKQEAVKPLSRFLNDPTLNEPAVSALLSIQTKDVEKNLIRALNRSKGPSRITMIKALGELRSRSAVKKILPFADDDNMQLRQVSLFALANIGDPAAESYLSHSRLAASPFERTGAPSLYLLYTRRIIESGLKDHGVKILRSLIENYTRPTESQIPCSSLSLLVDTLGKAALPDLIEAIKTDNKDVRATALKLADRFQGTDITDIWIKLANDVQPEITAEIITMLGRRNDDSSRDFLRNSLKSDNVVIRTAAIPAYTQAIGEESLEDLLPLLFSEDRGEILELKNALLMMPGELIIPEVVKILNEAPVPSKVILFEILADKRAVEQKDLFFVAARDKSQEIRLAALEGMSVLVGPEDLERILPLYLDITQNRENILIQNAIVAAASQIDQLEERSDTLIETIDNTGGKKRADLLRLLSRIGGQKALDTVVAHLPNEDMTIKNAAVVSLSRWPSLEAAPHLKKIIKKQEIRKFVYLAVQGITRLTIEADLSPQDKFLNIKDLIEFPLENEERKLIIRSMSRIPTEDSLQFVTPFLEEPDLKKAAASATARVQLALINRSQERPGFDQIMKLKESAWILDDGNEKQRILDSIYGLLKESGFIPLFNGENLDGWKGLVGNPKSRAKMSEEELRNAQTAADEDMRTHWTVKENTLLFDGTGHSLCTEKDYGDFEMFVDWKIQDKGDSGLYLRGSPQVQIWDPAQWPEGSGGLYNNKNNPSKPLAKADHPIGDWSSFYIKMVNDRIAVYLNDVLVVDNVIMENYWERDKPIYPRGQIELQAHSTPLYFRNIYIREILREEQFTAPDKDETKEGFIPLFNGTDMTGWTGDTKGYVPEDGKIVIYPDRGSGNLYTEDEFADFILRYEFKLTPGANNGLGIRTPLKGDAAYVGIELQILDNSSPRYSQLKPYQYHGSIYGVVPAKRGYLRPVGEWNFQEVAVEGQRIRVSLNGITIVDADIEAASREGTVDGRPHPGLKNKKGHIGFLGHGSKVEFRNIRIKRLK